MSRAPDDDPKEDAERVSLAPLDPKEALRALLKVDPESEPSKQKTPDRSRDEENRQKPVRPG